MKGNFQTLLKRFCLEGSVMGLKYFYLYPDRVSRFFWAATLLISLSVACLLSVFLYQRFVEMPTRITIENQFEPLHNLPYPAITICSPNQITISATEHFKRTLINGNLTFDLYKVIPQFLAFNGIMEDFDISQLEHLQNIIVQNRYTVANVVNMLPQRCDDLLKRCYFEGNIYDCGQLFIPVLTKLGMCCAFNSAYYLKDNDRNEWNPHFITHKVSRSGDLNALTVIADYNPGDAVDGTVVHIGAIRVMFTDWTEFPVDDVSSLVYSNAEFLQTLSATYTYCSDEVKQLPVNSRKCYFTDELTIPHFREYRHTDCELGCFVSEVEEICHCTMLYVPRVIPRHACNLTNHPCIKKVKIQMSKPYQNERCQCIRDCVSRKYNVDQITGNLNAIEHTISSNIYSGILINDSTTVIHFYFPTTVYVKQKQETVISLITLASNLGGVFGLCLGCSFISLIEIIFFVYVAIKNYIRKCLNMRRQSKIHYYN